MQLQNVKIQDQDLKQTPSIAEAISWAIYIEENQELKKEDYQSTAFLLAKNQNDNKIIQKVLEENNEIIEKIKGRTKGN